MTGRRWALGAALAFFAVTRAGLLLGDPFYSDVPLFYGYAVRGVDGGLSPYRDFGARAPVPGAPAPTSIEYPPGAWWVIAAPRMWSAQPVRSRDEYARGLQEYWFGFRRMMFVFDVAALALLADVVRRRRPEFLPAAIATHAATTALLGHVLYDRLDAGLLFLMALWAWTWCRPSRIPASWFVLGLGIAFKLLPGVMAPFLLLAEARQPRRVAAALVALLAGMLLPGIPFYRTSGWGVLGFLRFHADRPLQLESIWASVLFLVSSFGFPIAAKFSFGSWNLESSATPLLTSLSTVLSAGILAALGAWTFARRADLDRVLGARVALLALSVTVVLAKVLSPQYLVWALPLMLLLGAEILSVQGFAWLCAASLFVAALTTWVFPYHFMESDGAWALTPGLHPAPCAALVLRNAILATMVAGLALRLRSSSVHVERGPGVVAE